MTTPPATVNNGEGTDPQSMITASPAGAGDDGLDPGLLSQLQFGDSNA